MLKNGYVFCFLFFLGKKKYLQTFANIYMNELDKYIKEQIKIEYMVN